MNVSPFARGLLRYVAVGVRARADRLDRLCVAGASGDPLLNRPLGGSYGGSYVVRSLLGDGGMGRLYLAEQRMLGRAVALKVMHPHLLSDEQAVARFYTEARAAGRLNHPNCVGIVDFGRTGDDLLYIAMEYLPGRDLHRLVLEAGALPLARACEFVEGILAALAHAHAFGVLHCDVSPTNVVIVGDRVILTDFGAAQLLDHATGESVVAPDQAIVGTAWYAPPECAVARYTPRSDLYAVGALLFELLTSTPPYPSEDVAVVRHQHVHDPIPDPRDVAPDRGITAALSNVVMRAMAKSPSDRYATADVMSDALRQARKEFS